MKDSGELSGDAVHRCLDGGGKLQVVLEEEALGVLLADAGFDVLDAGTLGDVSLQALLDDDRVGVHITPVQGLLVESLAETADGVGHHAACRLLRDDDESPEGHFVSRDQLLVRTQRHGCHHLRRREAEREMGQLADAGVRVEVGDLLGFQEEGRLDAVLHQAVATFDVDAQHTRLGVPEVLAVTLADTLGQLVGAVVVEDFAGLQSLRALVGFEGDFHSGLEGAEADVREPAFDAGLMDKVILSIIAVDVAVAVHVRKHAHGTAQPAALLGLGCLRALGRLRLRGECCSGRVRCERTLERVQHGSLDGGGCGGVAHCDALLSLRLKVQARYCI